MVIKGAFTGAAQSTLGCFRAADGGTLFLDEIGDLDFDLQAKLLRVLQERKVTPVGSHDGIPVDVRVMAATNRNLEHEVRSGRFRLDLYYRLNVIAVESVALKDRPEDIAVLARHFLARAAVETGSAVKDLTPAAIAMMQAYVWPGNIRELQNLIERAVVFAEGVSVGPECFPELLANTEGFGADLPPTLPGGLVIGSPRGAPSRSDASPSPRLGEGRGEGRLDADETTYKADAVWPTLIDMERNHIARTLQETFYNQSAAARLLGINRKLLSRKIKKYGIRMPITQSGRSAKH